MLILNIAGALVAVLGLGYLLNLPITAEITAHWVASVAEVTTRALRAHAAGQRAKDAAYRTEHRRVWRTVHARQDEQAFWTGVAGGIWGEM